MHPLKKQKTAKQNPVLEYCSYSAMLLTNSKLCDDVQDEKGAKRFKARALRTLFKSASKKAKRALPGLYEELFAILFRLSELEKESAPSLDRCAELSGELIKEVFSYGLEGSARHISAAIGRNFGKLIYILDAVDDYYDDVRLNRFNPLSDVITRSEGVKTAAENLEVSMMNILADSESAFFLIEFDDTEDAAILKEIIDNVIYLGLPLKIKATLDKFLKEENNQNANKQTNN